MPKYKQERHDFDPADPKKRLEVGDVLLATWAANSGSVLVLTGREYLPDMSVVYRFKSTGKKTLRRISEKTLLGNGGGGYARIHKATRTPLQEEKIFIGTHPIHAILMKEASRV